MSFHFVVKDKKKEKEKEKEKERNRLLNLVGVPSENTRGAHPSPTKEPASSFTGVGSYKPLTDHQISKTVQLNKRNPKYMYSQRAPDNAVLEWWIDEKDKPKEDVTLTDSAMATLPVQSHTYSPAEMMAYSAKNRKPLSDSPKSFKEIIQAAIVLSRLLEKSLSSGDKKQPRWVHRPDRPYTQQEVVHLCCLVDVQRPLSVDTQYNETIGEIRLCISSYKLNPSEKLETYMKQKNKELDAESMNFYVYRPWLKKYLDWFNPALYQYITTHLDGVKVQRFQHRLAAEDQDSYDQQGRLVHDKLLVPLPKMHRVVSTKDDFGVVKADGSFEPYCKDTYLSNISLSQPVRHPTYDDSLTAGCNPANFEYVPVARMPRVDVPAHHMQIKAIRAQIKRDKQKNVTVRWLGLQGGKYVSLPPDWVTDNFDPIVLDEAQRRAQNEEDGLTGHLPERFLVIPPGDSRDDDPPFGLRHNRGLNYYYL